MDFALEKEVCFIPPVTFAKNEIKEFVGFGEKTPIAFDEISYYTSPEQVVLRSPIFTWVEKFCETFTGELNTKAKATQFVLKDGLIERVVINGDKSLKAEKFIYCGPPKDLCTLIPSGILAPRLIAKLKKQKEWTSIALVLAHKNTICDSQAVHVLYSGADVNQP